MVCMCSYSILEKCNNTFFILTGGNEKREERRERREKEREREREFLWLHENSAILNVDSSNNSSSDSSNSSHNSDSSSDSSSNDSGPVI